MQCIWSAIKVSAIKQGICIYVCMCVYNIGTYIYVYIHIYYVPQNLTY